MSKTTTKEVEQFAKVTLTEMVDIEMVVVKTLVTLPTFSPLVSPTKQRSSTQATSLKLHMPSTISQGAGETTFEDVSLDEVIELHNFDLSIITLDQMQILFEALRRKIRQEQLKQEQKKKQVLYDIKDIFVDAFDIVDINEDKAIVEQLVHIFDKVNMEGIEANSKLMAQSKKKYHTKVLKKISSVIALRQVDLSIEVEGVKKILESIYSLYTKLCDVDFFTKETQQNVQRLQEEL